MNDRYVIYTGLIIFIAMVTLPFWYNLGEAVAVPEVKLSAKALAAGTCVRSTDYMKTQHMQLLDDWRNSVVREGKRIYENPEGKAFKMSLTDTCLDCHSEKAEFCDRCHTYVSVAPKCWNCHNDPKENV